MRMRISESPDADAISKVIGGMEDDEIKKLMEELRGLYAIEQPAPAE